MDLTPHTHPDKLERYSFLWSEIRLVIAAVALFLGGIPPLLFLFRVPALYGFLSLLLTISWILSGLASGYLLYRWFIGGKRLFGSTKTLDTVAFFVSVISGINLGLAGIVRVNIGMALSSNMGLGAIALFVVAALLYLASAIYLFRRWKQSGRRVF